MERETKPHKIDLIKRDKKLLTINIMTTTQEVNKNLVHMESEQMLLTFEDFLKDAKAGGNKETIAIIEETIRAIKENRRMEFGTLLNLEQRP